MKITKRQKEVLDFIRQYQARHDYAPSLEEIRQYFGLASISTAHFHVKRLEEQGYLTKEENAPRAIDLHDEVEMVGVPIWGTIAAGKPIELITGRDDLIAVPKSRLPRSGEFYALKVAGDSMIQENIFDGDIVVARRQQSAETGEKVVAIVNGNSATLKKFYREKDKVRLQPANSNMAPMVYDADRVEIQGKVVAVVRGVKQ